MKNLYIIIFLLTLFGCKKSDDGTVEVIPLAPTELKGTVISKDQVDLSWKDNSTNETGYKIERKTDSGNFTEIGSTATDVTTFSDKTVSLNTNYTYRVYSFNKVGKSIQYSNELSLTTAAVFTFNTVAGANGKIWMDRNLGASRVATSSTDAASYGDLYQWGRGADGHQLKTSPTTSTLSTADAPGNTNFILHQYDWRSPKNDNLWQGLNGVNNPCPSGYRLPTEDEWTAEIASWVKMDADGIRTVSKFSSPLKLPLAGNRNNIDGSLKSIGVGGHYWSSTVSGNNALQVRWYSQENEYATIETDERAYGFSCRCIKNINVPSLTTTATTITSNGAKSGGNISSDGSSSITARGVVWGTSTNPTITLSTKTSDGTGTGSFQSVITGLAVGTKYYVRAYATNSVGTGYGEEIFFNTAAVFTFNTVAGANGKIWMDRNLGASRVATSSTDAASYGDLYQWGRGADGHQSRISGSQTYKLSTTDVPGNSFFILNNGYSPYDWRSPKNDNLWQGLNGVNNPCPSGYRLPTEDEWTAEIASWSKKNAEGAFSSPLKLPLASSRFYGTGAINFAGVGGHYWSSTVSGNDAVRLYFGSSISSLDANRRASGLSCRCIKD